MDGTVLALRERGRSGGCGCGSGPQGARWCRKRCGGGSAAHQENRTPTATPSAPKKPFLTPSYKDLYVVSFFIYFYFFFFFPPNIFNRDVSGVPFHADKPKMPQENFKAVFQVSSRDLQLNLQPHENKKTPNILSSKTRIDAQKILWNFLPCKYMMQYLSFGSLVQHAHFTTKMITD